MSMEQAILEHAAALRELSASIKAMYAGRAEALALPLAAGGVRPDADLEEAVSKVEKTAKQEKKAEAAPAAAEEPVKEMTVADLQAQLIYTTDVKPTLLKLNKEKGREALAGLLKKYNAPNGDKIKQDDLALILADAEALLAA